MTASKRVVRHAVNIEAHRLLIQQLVLQLRIANPKIVEEIYERTSAELQSHEAKSKSKRAFDAKVDAHIAELLSGAELRLK